MADGIEPRRPVASPGTRPLDGRLALVTGCSRRVGIGFAIADRLASLGADLLVHAYRPYDDEMAWGADPGGLPPLVTDLRRHGTHVESIEADLSVADAPQRVVDAARAHLDIVVANHTYSTMGALGDLTADEIDRHLAVNVRATMLLAQAFAAQHDGRAGGRIVLMISGQQLTPMPAELAYAASKGALVPLTTSLSAHLAASGVTVNAVNPGATDTGYAPPELYEAVVAMEPRGRWGRPQDAARLVGWLCTDDAEWITGQVINSTGGGP